MKRTLLLRRETLTPLTADDLGHVAGGGTHPPTCYSCFSLEQCEVPTLPLNDCKIAGGLAGG